MNAKLFLVLVVCLVCAVLTKAQIVSEAETKILLDENSARVLLAVESPNRARTDARIEFLDPRGAAHGAGGEAAFILKKGKNTLEIPVAISEIIRQPDFAFYRLRYTLGDLTGTLAVAPLAADVFDLEAFAFDLLQENSRYRVRVRAIQPVKLTGVGNVKMNAELDVEFDETRETKLSAEARTDAEGFAEFEFQLPKFTRIEDLELKITGEKNGFSSALDRDLYAYNFRQNSFLYFQTDKPLYQPSQMLRVRTLFFDADKKAIAGETLTFSIKDADGTILQKTEAKTSRFGVASLEWQIPENAKLGEYEIIAESARALAADRRYFKVSRYELPNFVVTAEADRKFYLPEQKTAAVAVRADYLFGKPVAKAKVRVVRELEREWNYKLQKYETKEGAAREGTLDADGKFTAEFDLTEEHAGFEDDRWTKFEDLRFAAYVTDLTTNRTEQRRFDVRLTKKPIHIYLVGETDDLSRQLPPRFYVTTFYADGSPAACDVRVYQAHEDSDDDEPKTGKFLTRLKTSNLGAGKTEIPLNVLDEDDDDLELVVTAKDALGNKSAATEDLDFDEAKPAVRVETGKIVYRAGEAVKLEVVSSRASETLYLDVMRNFDTLRSEKIKLVNGRATIEIPYRENFKNALTFVVYGSYRDDDGSAEIFSDNRTIVYPSPQGLRVAANAERETLRPNEEAVLNLSAARADGAAQETVFGVVVLDKAIEARARTDGEFGGGYRSFYSDLEDLLGLGRGFGGISGFEIANLDASRPLAPEAELAVEIALRRRFFPNVEASENFLRRTREIFQPVFANQLKPLHDALNRRYAEDALTPIDAASLQKILALDALDFDSFRDAWGNPFRASFYRNRDRIEMQIESDGADERASTADDLTALSMSFKYFYATGKKIDKALSDYRARTDDYIRDYKTLRAELLRAQNLDLDDLRDAWGKPYRFEFSVAGSHFKLEVKSGGWDRKTGGFGDFTIWTNITDYFTRTRADMSREFRQAVRESQRFPRDEAEFRTVLKGRGFDLDVLRDVFGRNYYVRMETLSRYADKVKINPSSKTEITPVTQDYVVFLVKSAGADGNSNNADDFELIRFVGIVSEKTKDVVLSGGGGVRAVPTSSASRGAIQGTTTDANGAVIPNTQVTALWYQTGLKFETVTDAEGGFVFADLPQGMYELSFVAAGFKRLAVQSVFVQPQQLTELDVRLEVGSVSEAVSVTSDSNAVDTTDSKIQTTVTVQSSSNLPNGVNFTSLLQVAPGASVNGQRGNVKVVTRSGASNDGAAQTEQQPVETPRLREYFPETLLWLPELLTDASGKAQVRFKLADNLTTWKIGVIASNETGDVGIAEKEIKAFQPFFAELEPPRFLTAGDRLQLPVPIRNYLGERQNVRAEMAPADWFKFLSEPVQAAEVAPNSTVNAVFDFQAVKPVKDGRQRVTATGAGAGDAIEKPVTVRPNGQEIVRQQTELFTQSAAFDINFPANALPQTPRAELKIYPNLFAHVTESVEGLLRRPYGCGEQTISSTYPNLMILKFIKGDTAFKTKARVFLKKGYERLLGYKADGGGFSYWGKDGPDLALTAYAYRFLTDAREFIEIDENVLTETRDYLVKKQLADGSFDRHVINTAYTARTLARNARDEKTEAALKKSLAFLKERTARFDEPYALALYALALLDTGDAEAARAVAERLESLAQTEGGAIYWNLETNTPFYGWGTAGRVETTALVLQLLTKIRASAAKTENQKPKNPDLISRATIFLLKNKDRYGVWYSTQTTINVLDAFLASLSSATAGEAQENSVQIVLNGENIQSVNVSPDQLTPIVLDLSDKLAPSANKIEIKSSDASPLMAQTVAAHYIDWNDARLSESNNRAVRLDYRCDKPEAKILDEVTCAVEAERTGFRGYGMLLAEIGLPPGADVSRESLENALAAADAGISRYEILPDRIVFYFWAKAGGTRFNFKFKPRYGINAQTPASVVYDYYNEEAKATLPPLKFSVK